MVLDSLGKKVFTVVVCVVLLLKVPHVVLGPLDVHLVGVAPVEVSDGVVKVRGYLVGCVHLTEDGGTGAGGHAGVGRVQSTRCIMEGGGIGGVVDVTVVLEHEGCKIGELKGGGRGGEELGGGQNT